MMIRGSACLGLACLLALAALPSSDAGCPFAAYWFPTSPNKLPLDHPAMKAYVGGGHAAARRALAQAPGGDFAKGAGTCSYVNPFTQSDTCVQLTGSKWEAEGKAWCEGVGPMPGTKATFAEGATCDAFADEQFAGVCINDKGADSERATAFVVTDTPFGGCDVTISACETFAQGTWDQAGGQCGAPEAAGPESGSLSETVTGTGSSGGKCALQSGIAGGGHMDTESYWDLTCPNANSTYSSPLRWTSYKKMFSVQNPMVQYGRVWYDLENNRKREDMVRDESSIPAGIPGFARNSTVIHQGGTMWLIDWDKMTCRETKIMVGNLRPNWIIDSIGFKAISQFMGSQYVQYEGNWTRVKSWRKNEPLEGAYMILMYDDEAIWETPEGPKRKPLIRQTPGAPFQGDAVDYFYDHSTDFSDEVFDVLDLVECEPFDFSNSASNFSGNFSDFDFSNGGDDDSIPLEGEGEAGEGNGTSSPGQGGGLNFNSHLHEDSSFLEVRCTECDITYVPDEVEERAVQEGAPVDGGGDVGPRVSFSGTKSVDKLGLSLEYAYDAESDEYSFTLRSETDNWLALAFPLEPCAMAPSESVIAIPSPSGGFEVAAYDITTRTLTGVVETNELQFGKMFAEKQAEAEGVTSLTVTRPANVGGQLTLSPRQPFTVTWAVGQTAELGYHGIDHRGCFEISP